MNGPGHYRAAEQLLECDGHGTECLLCVDGIAPCACPAGNPPKREEITR